MRGIGIDHEAEEWRLRPARPPHPDESLDGYICFRAAEEARVRQANDAYCKARAGLLAKRTEMEATDDYKRMSLDDRLALRRAIDDLIAANKPDGLDCDAR